MRARRYVRGVSNWNFDIEDLKARGLTAPRMPILPLCVCSTF
jgi:hypothetical protein